MLAQRQPDMAVVLDHLAALRHRPEHDRRLLASGTGAASRAGGGEERQGRVAERLDGPERLAAGQAQR